MEKFFSCGGVCQRTHAYVSGGGVTAVSIIRVQNISVANISGEKIRAVYILQIWILKTESTFKDQRLLIYVLRLLTSRSRTSVNCAPWKRNSGSRAALSIV